MECITRAARLCDELLVGVAINTEKKYWFDQDIRIRMVACAMHGIENVRVIGIDCLLAEQIKKLDVTALVRGARNATDFDAELTMADVNGELCSTVIDTVLIPGGRFRYISSSAVRSIALSGASEDQLFKFVPSYVAKALRDKVQKIKADTVCLETGVMGTVTQIYHPDGNKH
jgi:pantetheine-phosphate adenylyltransferase